MAGYNHASDSHIIVTLRVINFICIVFFYACRRFCLAVTIDHKNNNRPQLLCSFAWPKKSTQFLPYIESNWTESFTRTPKCPEAKSIRTLCSTFGACLSHSPRTPRVIVAPSSVYCTSCFARTTSSFWLSFSSALNPIVWLQIESYSSPFEGRSVLISALVLTSVIGLIWALSNAVLNTVFCYSAFSSLR